MFDIGAYTRLIEAVRQLEGVVSLGKSGGEALPQRDEGDIDLFVFCDAVPNINARRAVLEIAGAAASVRIAERAGRFWGVCDCAMLGDCDLCLMYFTVSEMDAEIESTLDGFRLDREGEYFYPTGRCATFGSMHILYDTNGYIAAMKKKLSVYPDSLARALLAHHIARVNDEEDFERAVSRGDVLFYHATIESALDHYLQALFALNRRFFPSRKRTVQFVDGFSYKPRDCAKRLLRAVELGARPETLEQSYEIWIALCDELAEMTD
ncbi:MAG TPA: DUF4037 domain-containing protein [Clostridia bacterium]|nr:DUF4037 domain-containing protein [Clostridia bacterium]